MRDWQLQGDVSIVSARMKENERINSFWTSTASRLEKFKFSDGFGECNRLHQCPACKTIWHRDAAAAMNIGFKAARELDQAAVEEVAAHEAAAKAEADTVQKAASQERAHYRLS